MAAPSTTAPMAPAMAMSSSAATASIPAKTAPAVPTQQLPILASLRDRIPKLEPRRRQPPPENATPVPRTPQLPPPSAEKNQQQHHIFAIPRRRILSRHDHDLFLASPSFSLLQAWVFGLADAVVDTPAGVFAEALAPKKGPAEGTDASTTTTTPSVPVSFPVSSPVPRRSPQKPSQRPLSPVIFALLSILDEAEDLLESCPPDETGGSRFGNKRFRVFVDLVRQRAPTWHRERLGLTDNAAVAEAAAYLGQSFGNRARIDYGSGHELHFIVWLLCLYQLGVIKAPNAQDSQDDRAALVLVAFARYLALMRRIQTTYYLEPAGSHGVWGLDDYQFLPFLFGAAQLKDHRFITPRAVHQPLTLEQFGDDYLYLGQVRFVNSIKVATGRPGEDPASNNSLRWHSPMLDDISATRSWAKVEAGMRRMFLAEVLRKLPVMQHFLFGSLVPPAVGMTEPSGKHPGEEHAEAAADEDVEDAEIDDEDEDAIVDGKDSVEVFDKGGVRHIHNPSGWGDCCGIRVPSSLGAAGEMRKRGGDVLRRIPFD